MTPLPRDRAILLPPVGYDIRGHAERFRNGLIASQSGDEFGFHAAFSQIVSKSARGNYHKLGDGGFFLSRQIVRMSDSKPQPKNGGLNHLRAWREFRRMSQSDLAKALNTNANVIGYLESGERGLSAKWLRRIAPVLKTSPGLLLDHDPNDLDSDLLEMWTGASDREKKQISDVAQALLRTGSEG